jgi:hypothetical protein
VGVPLPRRSLLLCLLPSLSPVDRQSAHCCRKGGGGGGGEESITHMAGGHRTPCPPSTCLHGNVRWRTQSPPFLWWVEQIERQESHRQERRERHRPGWISVTRMGVFTTSRKSEPVNARTAALDAQYTLPPAYDSLPAIDPTLMTWPVLRALKSVGWMSAIACPEGFPGE